MMLDPAVLSAPVRDHRRLDFGAARRVRYILEQRFRYEYEAPLRARGRRGRTGHCGLRAAAPRYACAGPSSPPQRG
jgi:hypothetical protein